MLKISEIGRPRHAREVLVIEIHGEWVHEWQGLYTKRSLARRMMV